METMLDQTSVTKNKVDKKRVLIYLAFAYGLAWLVGLAVYLLCICWVVYPGMTSFQNPHKPLV